MSKTNNRFLIKCVQHGIKLLLSNSEKEFELFLYENRMFLTKYNLNSLENYIVNTCFCLLEELADKKT